MSSTESNPNYIWYVDRRNTGSRKVLASGYSIDSHGNLIFYSSLPSGGNIQSHTFAAGVWTSVSLLQPELIDFQGILGS